MEQNRTFFTKKERDDLVEEINREYHEILYLAALKGCRKFGFPLSEGDDVMQMFYLKVLCNPEMVAAGVEEKNIAYLFQMIRNELIDLNRKKKTFQRHKDQSAFRNPTESGIYHLCVDLLSEQFMEDLKKKLSDEDFRIMDLYIQGYSYKEISEQIKMNPNTVATRIGRAKDALAGYFDRTRKGKKKQLKLF